MQNNEYQFNPYAQNIAIVKSYFKKPLVLTQGIMYIASAILSVISIVIMIPTINSYMDKIFSIPELTADMSASELNFMSSFMDVYVNAVMIIALVPSLIILGLIAAAHILMYVKSKNDNPSSSPKAGVKILYVLSIIQLIPIVLMCLFFLVFILIMIIGAIVIAVADSGSGEAVPFTILAVVYTVVFGIMGTVYLLFFINQMRYYKSILDSLTTVELSNKGAGIFGVMSIIYGVYLSFSALSSFAVIPMFKAMSANFPELQIIMELFESLTPAFAFSSVVSVLAAAIYIVNALIALGYKKHINNIKNGFNTVEYAPAVAVPAMSAQPLHNEQPSYSNEPNPQVQFSYDNFENPTAPHCPRCNSVINESDIFCNKCGTKVK